MRTIGSCQVHWRPQRMAVRTRPTISLVAIADIAPIGVDRDHGAKLLLIGFAFHGIRSQLRGK